MKPPASLPSSARRRAVLLMLGGAALPGAALAQSIAVPPHGARAGCVVTPEQTEGPYFIDHRLNRSDLRTDPSGGPARPGVPLNLTLTVSSLAGGACTALPDAIVDIWHCDAGGVYSSGEPAASAASPTRKAGGAADSRFLRGYQVTGADGSVRFATIYPGWYPGRAVHIHFKVRTRLASGRAEEFTSQLYFDDALNARAHAAAPYAARARRLPKNADDGLFLHDGGRRLLLAARETPQGVDASFDIALRRA